MWNLKKKKRYKLSYLPNRNRITYVENKPMVIRGKGDGDKLGNWDQLIHTIMYKIEN